MGMFDELYFNCPKCGRSIYEQLKICETPLMSQWRAGSPVYLADIFPEYQRHLIYDPCPTCQSQFVFDCTSGIIQIELYDGEEELRNPHREYQEQMALLLPIYIGCNQKDPEVLNVVYLSGLLRDPEILWFYETK